MSFADVLGMWLQSSVSCGVVLHQIWLEQDSDSASVLSVSLRVIAAQSCSRVRAVSDPTHSISEALLFSLFFSTFPGSDLSHTESEADEGRPTGPPLWLRCWDPSENTYIISHDMRQYHSDYYAKMWSSTRWQYFTVVVQRHEEGLNAISLPESGEQGSSQHNRDLLYLQSKLWASIRWKWR